MPRRPAVEKMLLRELRSPPKIVSHRRPLLSEVAAARTKAPATEAVGASFVIQAATIHTNATNAYLFSVTDSFPIVKRADFTISDNSYILDMEIRNLSFHLRNHLCERSDRFSHSGCRY